MGNPTLNIFYSLHYLLPFLITCMVFVHLGLLHKDGSNNPLGIKTKTANINFYPYIYVKDLVAFFALVLSLSIFVFYFPNALGEPDNYLEADPYSTPAHIVPEWYFLPFYAILTLSKPGTHKMDSKKGPQAIVNIYRTPQFVSHHRAVRFFSSLKHKGENNFLCEN